MQEKSGHGGIKRAAFDERGILASPSRKETPRQFPDRKNHYILFFRQ